MTHAPRLDADPPAEPLIPPVRPSLYDRFTERVVRDPKAQRLYSWLAPALVVLLAAVLRLWNLAAAHDLMNQFDETYYVKDAWTLSQLGYEAACMRARQSITMRVSSGVMSDTASSMRACIAPSVRRTSSSVSTVGITTMLRRSVGWGPRRTWSDFSRRSMITVIDAVDTPR